MTETHLWCVCVCFSGAAWAETLTHLWWKAFGVEERGHRGVEVFCGLLFGLISLNVTGASVLLLLSR